MGFRPPLVGILGILWIFWMSTAESFNISPVPNIIIDRPEQETHTPKNRSSYFGYSINLRHESIMIGAPRDQSTVYNQRNINEPGVIYKCTWSSNVTCHAYSVDKKGNEIVKEKKELKKSNDATEFKSNQMLGATMDGMNSESNSFVTCAPNFVFYRWISTRDETFYDDYQTGACYLVDETVGDQPHNTKRINPLTDLNKQLFYNLKNVPMQVFGMAQQGFSLHVNDEGEIISGSPGIWDGKGSVVTINKNGQTSVPAPTYDSLLRSPLFGYAVTSGKFDKSSDKTYFVASAPRFNNLKGNVFIFDISKIDQTKISFTTYFDKQINTLYKFNVKGFGDYFGYSVLAEDFNNDGRLDLAVSAPSYSDKFDNCDFGAVYIFMNQEPMKGQKVF